jgi:hypothetical protein
MNTMTNDQSPRGDLRRKVEMATNVAVLFTALLVAAYFGHLFWAKRGSAETPYQAAPGTRLALPRSYDFTAHERTLILAIQDGCQYCEASMPFYKEVAARVEAECSGYGVVAVLPNPPAAADRMLDQFGLEIPRLPNTRLLSLGVTGTPTMVLVDGEGTVLDVWVGELSHEGEQEVLALLKPASACS